MAKMDTYGAVTPADADSVVGIDVSDTTQSPQGSTARFTFLAMRTWLASFFASSAQGAKADTAVQPSALGNSAALNVGTTAGTVAAGNDSRITGAVQTRATYAITITTDTTLLRENIAGKRVRITIGTTAGTDRVITIGDAGSWQAGEDVVFEVVATSGGAVKLLGLTSNAITPNINNRLWAVGSVVTLERNSGNTGFSVKQQYPFFAAASGNYAIIYGDGPFKLAQVSSATDYMLANGKFYVQHTNSGAAGTVSREQMYAEGTLLVNDVSGTYATSAQVEVFSDQISYGAEWLVKLGLATAPHYNTAGLLSGLPPGVVGKRHSAFRASGTRYSDGKHWGGIAIGAESGALYNGSWAFFSEWGGFYRQRAGGSISEQRSTATGTHTITATEFSDSLCLAGSGDATVNFPQTPEDGQEWTVFTESLYTSITLAAGAAGATIIGGVIATLAGSFAKFRYRTSSNTWRRIG